MSAYAELVSILQILESVLDSGGLRIIQTRAQLVALREKVISLLDFLESSSACKGGQTSALETEMRMAAYFAEDLLESLLFRILHFRTRRLYHGIWITLIYILYACVIVSTNTIAVSYPETIDVLAVAAVSTATAVYVHLAVQVHGLSAEFFFAEKQEIDLLRRVLDDFNMVEEHAAKVDDAEGDLDISALISLRQILDSTLDSGGRWISRNRAHLECLQEQVSFLLNFLENAPASASASAFMKAQKSELRDAAYRANSLSSS